MPSHSNKYYFCLKTRLGCTISILCAIRMSDIIVWHVDTYISKNLKGALLEQVMESIQALIAMFSSTWSELYPAESGMIGVMIRSPINQRIYFISCQGYHYNPIIKFYRNSIQHASPIFAGVEVHLKLYTILCKIYI